MHCWVHCYITTYLPVRRTDQSHNLPTMIDDIDDAMSVILAVCGGT